MNTKSFIIVTITLLLFTGTSLVARGFGGGGREGERPNEGMMRSDYHPNYHQEEYRREEYRRPDYGARAVEGRRAYERGAENEALDQGGYGGGYDYLAPPSDGDGDDGVYNGNYEINTVPFNYNAVPNNTVPQETQQQAQQFLED